ncbi:MerR family transcriptional regulator [Streptomyces sp. MP131-18]|uniref:MerR family transcriptional regulator n=1 Tax=Streptomyces sp. MP131-18 TaxID=1857892 RepID=UPI00097BB85B|nr:MerR family transcriptional regulator [Streptomyces sp. MP131-18]ONK13034.1 Mercuric resistance operon regulatory protein [Streptomyces sp. MP131-18]
MLIGELSRQTGVHTHQLRYYETQGLLEPGRGANGYREYTDDAVVTVSQIRKLLHAGLSTQDIGFLLPCATGAVPDLEPCPELLDALRARLRDLDDHIDTLTRSRKALHDYIDATEHRMPDNPRTHACDSPAPATPSTPSAPRRTRRR